MIGGQVSLEKTESSTSRDSWGGTSFPGLFTVIEQERRQCQHRGIDYGTHKTSRARRRGAVAAPRSVCMAADPVRVREVRVVQPKAHPVLKRGENDPRRRHGRNGSGYKYAPKALTRSQHQMHTP
eukprot:gene1833-biopygen4804